MATGGNAGGGTNSAIGLMALTGSCSSLSSSTFVVANELTTAAAQWAMAQFLDSTGALMGTSSSSAIGLNNAVNQAESDLAVSYLGSGGTADNTGIAASFLPSSASCTGGSPPVNCDGLERLDMLANILAACDTSSGLSSTPCSTLFTQTGVSNSSTMLAVAHAIVTNPVNNVSAIFGVQQLGNAPFQPTLSSAPGDLTLALNFAPAGAGLNSPQALALDSSGNVFVANGLGNSVSELTAGSSYGTGFNFRNSTGASFLNPSGIALDSAGNVFVVNNGNGSSNLGSVSELTAGSSYGTGLNFNPVGASLNQPQAIALDSADNVFVTNGGTLGVSELTAASTYLTGSSFDPASASILEPESIALDASGNVFVANGGAGSISELTASSSYGTGSNFSPAGAAFNRTVAIALDGFGDVFVANTGEANPSPTTTGSVSELFVGSGAGDNFTPAGAAFGINVPHAIALDGSGNAFVAAGNSVSELTEGSSYGTGLNFTPAGANFQEPLAIALDGSGDVFVANGGNSVGELIGLGTPVLTPIQANLDNINACAVANGGCDTLTICTNTVGGGASCGVCPSGYTGTGKTGCININECLVNNGGCDPLTACIDTAGSFACGDCPTGYNTIFHPDGTTVCGSMAFCAINNGGCDLLTTCTNIPGSFVCGPCPAGYTGTGLTGCLM